MQKNLIIATRKSPLAVWQANWVKTRLEWLHPELKVSLLGMSTRADTMLDTPLDKMGGKAVFVKELEEALLDGRADIAVHSMKDVPMDLPPGLCIPVMCEREDPRDAFVSHRVTALRDLPSFAVIGTSSLRRQSQIRAMRPDVVLENLRGNVNTRLKKLSDNQFAALILAAAGLKRLGLESRISSYLSIEECLPAAGQGVLGVECREGDEAVQTLIKPLNHLNSMLCVTAERAMCRMLGGGCHAPVAAYAEIVRDEMLLRGLVASPSGENMLRVVVAENAELPEKLGKEAANYLIKQGAKEVLNALGK